MAINPLLAGAGVIGAAAAVGGGLYVSGILTKEEKISEKEPEGHSRSKDSDYTASGGKYGQIYGAYLVGMESNNDSGGEGSYNGRYKTSRKTKNGAFEKEITNGETLKAACQRAYEGMADGEKQEISIDNISFKETEIGKFCSSPGKKEIQTVRDMGGAERFSGQTQYGGTKYRDLMAASKATSNKANQQFGKDREDKFKSANDLSSGSIFKELKEKTKVEITVGKNKVNVTTVREVCGDAYGKKEGDASTSTKYPKIEVFKFCSLTGVAPDDQA